ISRAFCLFRLCRGLVLANYQDQPASAAIFMAWLAMPSTYSAAFLAVPRGLLQHVRCFFSGIRGAGSRQNVLHPEIPLLAAVFNKRVGRGISTVHSLSHRSGSSNVTVRVPSLQAGLPHHRPLLAGRLEAEESEAPVRPRNYRPLRLLTPGTLGVFGLRRRLRNHPDGRARNSAVGHIRDRPAAIR